MKEIFGLIPKSDVELAEKYITKRSDQNIDEMTTELFQKINTTKKKFGPLQIVCFVLEILLIIIIGSTINSIADGVSFATAWNNASFIFISFPFILAADITLRIILHKRKKTILPVAEEEQFELAEKIQKVKEDYYSIPDDFLWIDIIRPTYKDESQKKKFGSLGKLVTNQPQQVYIKDDNLILVNIDYEVTLPVSIIKSFMYSSEKLSFYFWNKDEHFNDVPYKEYKIRHFDNGLFDIKGSGHILCNDDGDEFLIRVMIYDFDSLMNLLKPYDIPLLDNDIEQVIDATDE